MVNKVSTSYDKYFFDFNLINFIVVFLNFTCSAIVSLSSAFFAVYWKDVLSVSIFVFALVTAFIGKVLKYILAHKRPSTKEKENIRTSYGMPSSHANSLFYFVSFLTTYYTQQQNDVKLALQICFCTSLYTIIVLYARIFINKDHTILQCVAGCLSGSLLGYLACTYGYHWIENNFY